MKKIVSIIAMVLMGLIVNAQVQRPANLPSSNSPSSWYTYFGILDSAKMSVERDSFPSKYPALIKHIDHNYYYTNGNGGPWYKLVDTSGLSYRINQRVQYSDTSAMLQNYKSNINYLIADTAYQAAQIAARVKYTDTSSMLSGYGRSGQVVKYSDTASMLANRLKISDTTTMLVPYLRKSDTASMLSNRLKISDTSHMLTPYHQAFYTASFDTSARILYLVPITGGSPTAVLIPKGSSSAGITTLTPYRTTGSNVQFLLADNGNKPGFSLNTIDSLTKVHYSDTAGIVSGYVRQGYPVLYNDTTSMLSNRLKISDTTTMMSGYLRKGNATSGTVTQVNTNNGSGITGGSFTNTGTIAADTTILSTKANVTASILGKVNIADTSSMLSNYRRKTTLIQNTDLANSTISGISLGSNLNNLTFNNGGSGASSGTTYNGNTAQTISYNTIGAQPLATNLTSLSGLSYSSLSFVKMSASGTFSLDNNTYLTSSTGVTAFSGGSTGFTPNTLVSGSVTLSGTLVAANGGTGYTSLSSLAGDAAFTGAFQAKATNLTSLSALSYASTSFVKMTAAGTFALDVNTYLTTSSASSTYLPLAGGTLTGALSGTSATFASSVTASSFSGSGSGITGLVNSNLSGSAGITNANLANSSVTINSTAVSLGGSITITANSPNSLTINNSGSGASSGSTYNGGSALTISYNTIGAQPLSTNLTSLSGLTYASTSFVKMTAAGTFALDVNTYLTTSSASSTYVPYSGATAPLNLGSQTLASNSITVTQTYPSIGLVSTGWSATSYLQNNLTINGGGGGNYFVFGNPTGKGFSFVVNSTSVASLETNSNLTLGATSGTGTGTLYAGAISGSTGTFSGSVTAPNTILNGTGTTTTLVLGAANGVGSINWKNGAGTASWATYMPVGTTMYFRDQVNGLDLLGLIANTGILVNGSVTGGAASFTGLTVANQAYSTGSSSGYTFYDRSTGTQLWLLYANSGSASLFSSSSSTNVLSLNWSTGAATFASSVTASSFFNSSDIRLKNITERYKTKEGFDFVIGNWKLDSTKQKHYWYVAQEVEKVYPFLVNTDAIGMKSVNYTELHTKEIYDLQKEIYELKKELIKLKSKMK